MVGTPQATDCDICVISEHKLKPRCLPYINTIEQDYECISKADILPGIYNAVCLLVNTFIGTMLLVVL
jgi:hypothetical protein